MIKKTLNITATLVAVLFTSPLMAEEVPPDEDPNGTLYRGIFSISCSPQTTPSFPTIQGVLDFYDSVCSGYDSGSYVLTTGAYKDGSRYRMPSQDSGPIQIGQNSTTTGTVYSCPSTHPVHIDNNSDGQINAGDSCSNQSSSCDAGKVIGSQTLTNSGQPTACIPSNDASDTYCSYERRQQYDHSYQPYTVYVMTGNVCSGLDSDVIEDPYGLDNPSDYKEPDLGCTAISNEYQSCPADPNKECSTQNGVTTCSDGCGWSNDEFVCISTMNNDNQDGDSENTNNPNNDTDGDGEPDTLGVLQDIDKNTDELEKIGRDMIRAIKGIEGSGSGGAGGNGGDANSGEDNQEPNCPNGYYIGEQCVSFSDFQTPTQNSLDNSVVSGKITTIKQEIESQLALMQSEANQMFSVSLPSGQCSSDERLIFGVSVDFSLCRWRTELASIGAVALFMFAIMAMLIIMGGKRD